MRLFENRKFWCFGQAGPVEFSRADPWVRFAHQRGATRSVTPSPFACTRPQGPASWGWSDCRSGSACLAYYNWLWTLEKWCQSYHCWMLLGPGPCPKQKNRTVVSKHIDNDVFDKHSVNLFKFLPFFLLGYKNQYWKVMQYGSDNVLRLLLKRRIGGSHGFKRILFCCPFLQMQAYAYGKNKEM
jgi:hypothetical protein